MATATVITKETRTGKFNPYQAITDRIIAALKQGDIPWRKPWKNAGTPMNLVSKRPYRGINVFILGAMPYESPYWLTFNQCKQLGGHVLKGEKATAVVFWKTGTYEAEDDAGETETRRSFLMRLYYVFNVEQTNLANAAKEMQKEDPREIVSCEDVLKAYIGRPDIKHGVNSQACYHPLTDIVEMPLKKSFDTTEHYYAVLFHELVHSTGHEKRLNREVKNGFGSEKYAKEELVAEMGSAFLCGLTGIDKPALQENTVAYIQSWIKALQNDPKMVVQAAGLAQRAADLISGRPPKKESESVGSEETAVA
jgi:antirestriction protein ArdC